MYILKIYQHEIYAGLGSPYYINGLFTLNKDDINGYMLYTKLINKPTCTLSSFEIAYYLSPLVILTTDHINH